MIRSTNNKNDSERNEKTKITLTDKKIDGEKFYHLKTKLDEDKTHKRTVKEHKRQIEILFLEIQKNILNAVKNHNRWTIRIVLLLILGFSTSLMWHIARSPLPLISIIILLTILATIRVIDREWLKQIFNSEDKNEPPSNNQN